MRTMPDSVTAADIPNPSGVAIVAGYIDGAYAWSAADWSFFPNAVKVRIAVLPSTNDGHVLDVESGDATPTQAPAWVAMRRAAGVDPSVYTSASEWPAVRQAFAAAGIAEPHYWIAQWDGVAALLDGAVAKQYANPTLTGGHFDASSVADFWPGVDEVKNVNPPQYQGESVVTINLVEGEVQMADAIYYYDITRPDGSKLQGNRAFILKFVGRKPGFEAFCFYPPADPDADPTIEMSAQPAVFVVATRPKEVI